MASELQIFNAGGRFARQAVAVVSGRGFERAQRIVRDDLAGCSVF
jgi:hypothetical protein